MNSATADADAARTAADPANADEFCAVSDRHEALGSVVTLVHQNHLHVRWQASVSSQIQGLRHVIMSTAPLFAGPTPSATSALSCPNSLGRARSLRRSVPWRVSDCVLKVSQPKSE